MSCVSKDKTSPSRKSKDKIQKGRKIFQIIYLIKDLYSEYIKNSYNSTMKRQIAR